LKAFSGYFGANNKSKWAEHDATELIKKYKGPKPDILIDVGTGDNFYKQGQLLPEHFEAAAKEAGFADSVKVRYQQVQLRHSLLIGRATITAITS
jgi:S-formylglutathione hydrolase